MTTTSDNRIVQSGKTINGDDPTVGGSAGESYYLGDLEDFWFRANIENVLDHIRSRIRKTSTANDIDTSTKSAISFNSKQFINSSLIFCRAQPSQCNLSTNPTYTDSSGKIIAKDDDDSTFAFVTTVGLHDANGDLLAVAKTSRPIEKNPEVDLTIRVRIDY